MIQPCHTVPLRTGMCLDDTESQTVSTSSGGNIVEDRYHSHRRSDPRVIADHSQLGLVLEEPLACLASCKQRHLSVWPTAAAVTAPRVCFLCATTRDSTPAMKPHILSSEQSPGSFWPQMLIDSLLRLCRSQQAAPLR